MMIAFELKMSLSEIYERMDQEEMGWWLAFFKVKAEREKTKNRSRPRA